MILKFDKRSFSKASLNVLPFTIMSVPPKSEKQNKKSNKVRKTCGFKIFKSYHLIFTLMVGCWWFLKNITRLVSWFITQDSLLQPTNTHTLKGKEMEKPLQEDYRYFRQKPWKRKIILSLVIVLHISIIDYNKKFTVCFFEILQALNFPTQYDFKKYLNSCF